jgi:hypothetical protein
MFQFWEVFWLSGQNGSPLARENPASGRNDNFNLSLASDKFYKIPTPNSLMMRTFNSKCDKFCLLFITANHSMNHLISSFPYRKDRHPKADRHPVKLFEFLASPAERLGQVLRFRQVSNKWVLLWGTQACAL